MRNVACLALFAALAASVTAKTVGIDATVTEIAPDCYVCRVAAVGKPHDVTLAAREINVEEGRTATVTWSEDPKPSSWIDYNATCSVSADGSKATVVVKIRARDGQRRSDGTYTAIVKPQR